MSDRDGTGPGADDVAGDDRRGDGENGGSRTEVEAGAGGGDDRGDGVDGGAGAEPGTPTDADDGRDWEFSLEDIRRREAEAAADAEAAERRRQPLEPGDPSMESVFFVLLGVVLTLFILSRLVVG